MIVKKLKVSEISMLIVLFKYKNVDEMITENTRDIENGINKEGKKEIIYVNVKLLE